jgi:cytochrome c oxidase accessory protein FixG
MLQKDNQRKKKGKDFLYPKKPSGKLYTYRKWFSYTLLLFLLACPFLKFKGEQWVLLNFIERKFVFFGLIFTPQDFYLFALAMLVFVIFIVCFTVVLGRLWCGWACPQTIFMEMIFRRIEYWIEGDAVRQKKLDSQPWNTEKILKKGSKHFLFIGISFIISNTFLAYLIGSDTLKKIITEPLSQHLSGFISIWFFTFIFYGVFAYVREVVCTVICPYGRLQGVLLDKQSLVVAYDANRGEPRGRIQKSNHDKEQKGDCVDCGLCVQVCPTGIDIRKGTQLECVNCTACIDACDEVMLKINREPKLIGFYNQDFIETRKSYKISVKAYAYVAVLFAILIVFSSLIYNREDIQTTVLRASGTLFQDRGAQISSLYNGELSNKTNKNLPIEFRATDPANKIEFIQQTKILPAEGNIHLTFFLLRNNKDITTYKTDVSFEICVDGKVLSRATTSFFAQP